MKFNNFTLVGFLVIVIGILSLVYPRIPMPASEREVGIGDTKLIMKTQRIVVIPRVLGALVVVCGVGLVTAGIRKK